MIASQQVGPLAADVTTRVSTLLRHLWDHRQTPGYAVRDLPNDLRDDLLLTFAATESLIQFGQLLDEGRPWAPKEDRRWINPTFDTPQPYGAYLNDARRETAHSHTLTAIRLTEAGEGTISRTLLGITTPAIQPDVEVGEVPEPAKRFHHRPWHGSKEWQNWGLAKDTRGHWRLYHFRRGVEYEAHRWVRHVNTRVQIARGQMDSLASKFAIGEVVHAPTDAEQRRLKPAICRVRKVIQAAVNGEGHRPNGNPIPFSNAARAWSATVRFGIIRIDGNRHVDFVRSDR